MNRLIRWEPIPKYGELFTVRGFIAYCKLRDADGIAYMAMESAMSDVLVTPSAIKRGACFFPDWCSHVAWFPKT